LRRAIGVGLQPSVIGSQAAGEPVRRAVFNEKIALRHAGELGVPVKAPVRPLLCKL